MFRSRIADQALPLDKSASVLLVLLGCLVQGCTSPEKQIQKSGAESVSVSTADSKIRAQYRCSDGYQLQYELWPPDDGGAGPYPLVLCLHGKGGTTHAPRAILGRSDIPPCFILAPSVPSEEFSWAPNRRDGMPYVFELLDELLEEEAVDPGRIYITGQSMGGFGTFAAVSARPTFFAAAIPICGGWYPGDAVRIHHVPIWIFHGDQDQVVSVQYSREMNRALQAAGGRPRYTELPGVRHNAWRDAYQSEELWRWMFAQRIPIWRGDEVFSQH